MLCKPEWLSWYVLVLAGLGLGFVSSYLEGDFSLDYFNSEDWDHSCDIRSFMCLDGACIPHSWLCDGKGDCIGGEDEDHVKCQASCLPRQFQCSNGACLGREFYCDGVADCADADDEKNCNQSVTCRPSEVLCNDFLECIPTMSLCDGEPDCIDGSDETNCKGYTCSPDEFRCGNSTECISNSWRCDGVRNCDDGSDEICSEETLKCETFLCKDKSKCLDYRSVCDGHVDCHDGSDEANNCSVACHRMRCSYACTQTERGLSCACPKGYMVHPENKLLCKDVDECVRVGRETQPACSQSCLNTKGSYHCVCMEPYALEPDRHTCRMRHPDPILLLSGSNEILMYSLRNTGTTLETIQTNLNLVVDMEVDSRSRRLFWVDYNDRKIYYTKLTGERSWTDKPVYVNVGLTSPRALSYNWHADLLYILDSFQGIIVACTVEGLACAVVVDGLADRRPTDVLVDPLYRTLFWIENEHPSAIMRSDLDGRNKGFFLETESLTMEHLLIDYPTHHLYWVDTHLQVIFKIPLDAPAVNGTGSLEVFTSYGIQHPTALAVVEDWVIWAERSSGVVLKANKWTGGDRQRVIRHHQFVTGAVVLHPALQPDAGDNVCWQAQCSQMCVESQNERGYRCLCPPEMVLHSDGVTCSWVRTTPFLLVGSRDQIFQIPTFIIGHINLRQLSALGLQGIKVMDVNPVTQEIIVATLTEDGQPLLMKSSSIWSYVFTVEVIEDQLDYLGEPQSLAVDWAADQVYWLNGRRNTIEIIKTSGQSRSWLSFEGVTNIKSIALSVPRGLLFFCTWGEEPKIFQCSMDGTNCSAIVSSNLHQPSHLLFYGGRLFWNDQYLSQVSSMAYGSREINIEAYKRGLRDFTVYRHLYYNDNNTGTIHLYNSEEAAEITQYHFQSMDIQDLVMLIPREKDPELPCSHNNGGCSDICVTLPEKRHRCLCPFGKVLSPDQQTCQVSEFTCSPQEVLCISSRTCILKADLCQERVNCQILSSTVHCLPVPSEVPKEEESECPSDNRCGQFCSMTDQGPTCSCDQGFSLASDHTTCSDVDECSVRNGYCSQLCHNQRGSYSCGCVRGYSLISDKVSCHSADHDSAYLIVSTIRGLFVVEMDGEREYPVLLRLFPHLSFDLTLQDDWQVYHKELQNPARRMDAPYKTHFVWSEIPGIYLQKYSGTLTEKLSTTMMAMLVRVDQVTRNMYSIAIKEMQFSFVVCDNELTQCVSIMTGVHWIPIALVLHPAKRMMYWIDMNLHTLNTAFMDGKGQTMVAGGVFSILDGMTLCPIRERLYWIDPLTAGGPSIWTSKVDGSDRYSLGAFPRKHFFAIDMFEGFLFLTEQKANSVYKMSTFSSRPVLSEMRRMDSTVQGIRVVHSAPKIANPCAMFRCSNLCLLSRTGAKCMCPQHVLLHTSPEGCSHDNTTTPLQPPLTTYHPYTPHWQPPFPLPLTTVVPWSGVVTPSPGTESGHHHTRPPYEVCLGFCLNGAFCQFVNGKPVCSCSFGFTGRRCELVAPTKGSGGGRPSEGGIVVDNANKTDVNGTVNTAPHSGSSSDHLVAIIVPTLALFMVAGVAAVLVWCWRRRARKQTYTGVEFNMESDEAFLVPDDSNDGSSYIGWDLDSDLLERPDSSLETGGFRSPAPIFNPAPSPVYIPMRQTK